MAYSASTLFKVGGANPALWLYHSPDALSAMVASGYFSTSTNSLKQNDVILVVGVTGGTRICQMLVVASATGAAVVTTINGTA